MPGIEMLLRGKVLSGRYRIEEVIGRGGMGVVYRAFDERLGRAVAVKVITVADGEEEARERMRARFRHEAASAARLPHHPNVVPVHDYGTDPELGIDFIVMELLRGEDLAERLRRVGPPPLGLALRIVRDAARGVAVGHRAGIIHRDVKPGNLFLVEGDDPADLHVCVLDFGIAKVIAGEDTYTALTRAGQAPLSPAFASPEQLRGDPDLTPAADVYGLGTVAFQLLTGAGPFSDGDRSLLSAGIAVPLPSIAARNPAVPPSVEAVVRRAMAHDPAERFPGAAALAGALDAELRRLPDEAAGTHPAAVAVPGRPAEADRTMPGPAFPEDSASLPAPAAERRTPSPPPVVRRRPRRAVLRWAGAGMGVLLLGAWIAGQVGARRQIERAVALFDSQQYSAAYSLFAPAAEDGDAAAQAYLGRIYEEGKGVRSNDAEALRWYRAAAEQGNAVGQAGLGYLYAQGRGGVARDDAEALRWTRLAAEQGDARGQHNLAHFYYTGRDYPRAIEWYRKAAEQGFAKAQFAIGYMYAAGQGVPQDDSAAVAWYRKAAEQGEAGAQASLGTLYREGRGVKRDYAAAREWFRKAAEQGSAAAQTNLGYMYQMAEGVPRDDAEAERWYQLAADRGDTIAQANLRALQGAWVVSPLYPGLWRSLEGDARRAELTRVSAQPWGQRIRRLRRLDPAFYDDAVLFEAEIHRADGQRGVISYARAGDGLVVINGRSDRIYELNRTARLRITTIHQAAEYLRFFVGGLQADAGRFRLVDEVDDLLWQRTASSAQRDVTSLDITMLQLQPDESGGWQATGTVEYAGAIFRAYFRITPDGEVDMTGDVPLAELTLARERFDAEGVRMLVESGDMY